MTTDQILNLGPELASFLALPFSGADRSVFGLVRLASLLGLGDRMTDRGLGCNLQVMAES